MRIITNQRRLYSDLLITLQSSRMVVPIPNTRLFDTHIKRSIATSPSSFPFQDLQIFKEFITLQEEQELINEINKKFKRTPYLDSHFDKVIFNYREMPASNWNPENQKIIDRMKQVFPDIHAWKPIHILDL